MFNTWWFNVIIYLILQIAFTQSYKLTTKKCKNDGALTILIQFLSGVIVLALIPLFKMQFPSNYKTYIFLGIACIFYAIADRVNTSARKGLEVSVYSILSQLSTVFIIAFGILVFKEDIIIKKLIGAALIIIANIFVIYRKGKFEWNKYVLFSIIGNLAYAIGVSVDVGISDQFNMPIYIGITLIVPSLLIMIFERINPKKIIEEFKAVNKVPLLTVCSIWGIMIISMLRAYKFGSVTTIAPICATTTILNVFVAYFLLKEKDSLLKKILAALLIIIGIILIKI